MWSDSVNDYTPIHPDTRIVPVFAAIPMGWTHSLAVCQAVLEGLSRKVAGITADNTLVDRKIAPAIDPIIHTEYADNFESYAYHEPLVAKAARVWKFCWMTPACLHTTFSSQKGELPWVGSSPTSNRYLAYHIAAFGVCGCG